MIKLIFISFSLVEASFFRRFLNCICCGRRRDPTDASPRNRLVDSDDSIRAHAEELQDYGSLESRESYIELPSNEVSTSAPISVPPNSSDEDVPPPPSYEEAVLFQFGALLLEQDSNSVQYIPRIDGRSERTEHTRVGIVEIGSLVGSSESSLVFNLNSHPGYVIKYTTNCIDIGTTAEGVLHPLARDYFFLSLVAPEENFVKEIAEDFIMSLKRNSTEKISPRPIYLSPPAFHNPFFVSRKVDFRLSQKVNRQTCVSNRALIRYMIMEEIEGITVSRLTQRVPHGMLPIVDSVHFGIPLVRIIRHLHDIGVVHNDIHGGNIVLTEEGIMLIDFGRSRIIEDSRRFESTRTVASFGQAWADAFNSPWEIAGYEQSVRDDLYKAFESMALWMRGTSLIKSMRIAEFRNLAGLYRWKASGNIFESLPDGRPGGGKIDSRVVERMGELLNLVRSIERGNMIEIFDLLLQGLGGVYSLADLNGL